MTRTLALLLVLAGCERVDEPREQPAPVARAPQPPQPTLAPPARADPGLVLGAAPPHPSLVTLGTLELTYSQPARRGRAHDHAADPDALPRPPSDEPAAYERWHAALAPAVRARLDAFCRRDGLTSHAECGGIGPYHIPSPPSLAMTGGDADHAAWLASLTPQQRHYVVYWCEDNPTEYSGYSELCGGTPLVVQFDPALPIEISARGIAGVNAAQTPWLVLDRNGDGAISIAELFGDATPLADGTLADNGFAALAQYDANADGVIDARDPVFARLALWNGLTLEPLAARCNRFGCEGERSRMVTTAGTRGAVVDVYLRR